MKVFENAETLTNGKLRKIAITAEIWEQEPELKCDTTYSIILARLFNLSYVDFLKYAVKNYNATIVAARALKPSTIIKSTDTEPCRLEYQDLKEA